jgi:hypothetical protein
MFGSFIKLAMDVVTTPIAIAKDVITLGGAITDEPSALGEKADQIANDWQEIKESL